MTKSRTAPLLRWAALAAVLVVGCDDASGGRALPGNAGGGGKADDAQGEEMERDPEEQRAFIEAVGRCEALADRGRKTIAAARIEQRLTVETDRLACLREATDDVLAPIEVTLQAVESPMAGHGEDAFTGWRETNASLCDLLVAASAFAVEKNAEVHEAACIAQAEVQLAHAIVTYADLGGTPAEPPEARAGFADCYEAFDAALEADEADEADEEAPAPEEERPSALETTIAAHRELASCIQLATTELDEELASRVSASFPGRGMANLYAQIEDDFEDTTAAAETLCNVLGSASIAAGDPEAELHAASCTVAASIWRARLIGLVVPELAPAEEPMP